MFTYSEAHIEELVRGLDRSARTAFAAACAEILWPLVERYAEAVALQPDTLRRLRDSLDIAWNAENSGLTDVHNARELAEALVPYEDEDWRVESGYAQNAIAAIAYAARCWLTDDPQEAVWASRQVWAAGDFAAQQIGMRGVRVYTPAVQEQRAQTPIVETAERAVYELLDLASTEPPRAIRQRTQASAVGFVARFP